MFVYEHLHRVRYRECDPMGYAYHAHYVDYFEVARTEALRQVGLPYKAIEDSGIIMPVIDLSIQYRRPAFYDDMLSILCMISELPSTRLTIDYEVRRHGEKELLSTGKVTLCFVDAARNRPIRAPEHVIETIRRGLTASACD